MALNHFHCSQYIAIPRGGASEMLGEVEETTIGGGENLSLVLDPPCRESDR